LIEEGPVTVTRTSHQIAAQARGRLVTALLAVGAGAVLAVGGCSAGQVTQTSSQVPPVPGTNADAGPISLRNLLVVYNGPQGYPTGSDAPLAVSIFNSSTSSVTLVGVSSDIASSVTLTGTPTVITPTATPTPAQTTASAQPTGSVATTGASGSVTPTGSPTPTATASAPAPAAAPLSIAIPPQSYVLLLPGQGGGNLVLHGLTQALAPGESTKVTFTFSNGTTVTLDVPLVPTSAATVTRDPAVVPSA
jgi:copper(I)-binding protein